MYVISLRELFHESPSTTLATISNGMGDYNLISVFEGHRSDSLSGGMVPPILSGAGYFVEANDIKW